MIPTKFQLEVQKSLKEGKNILLIAPTGLGKTFAVTSDLQDKFNKTVYAVPLRSLGGGIQSAIHELKRNGEEINPVLHHGDSQESMLFSEEVVVTTYDQVVCGVPGLPLSLPLKAGHAVAGALLMSRLILDEVHLAWNISRDALSILLGIIDFRNKFGLQTIVFTATLPKEVAERISERLNMELLIVGEGGLKDDEGLKIRENNRKVTISTLELKKSKELDYSPLYGMLEKTNGKRIYFSNTVKHLQETYDKLINAGMTEDKITVLHNRMPRSWRKKAEEETHTRFGKESLDGDWLLLTNQVAEAGLDISADLVISDPAPVDTLVQRAGRCARWFRGKETCGEFKVIGASKAVIEGGKGIAVPYRSKLVLDALKSIPKDQYLIWDEERRWIDKAWGGGKKDAKKAVKDSLDEMTYALYLFDRAAQEHKPGEIANVFREILSIEVAVESGNRVYMDDLAERDLQAMLDQGKRPETSSISLGTAWGLVRDSDGGAAVIRYEDGGVQISPTDSVRLGDVLVLPSAVAHLHPAKGLCIGDGSVVEGAICSSEWIDKKEKEERTYNRTERRQKLIEHTQGVMDGTYCRLAQNGSYRDALIKILKSLEPQKDTDQLANVVAQLARVAAAFHDVGKADQRWQDKARSIDPDCSPELIGRTLATEERIGIPHAPPCYNAIVKTCELLIGSLDSAEYLVRTIALSAARHHSSFLNPATVAKRFQPHVDTAEFVQTVLKCLDAPSEVRGRAEEIIKAAIDKPTSDKVPSVLPNNDLFPIYALVGRAIIMADREDAAGHELEQWRATS
ncbi:MAG: CRISPR-associated helicase Cas3' [Candidatus Zixiibacteriota bacterium]|nr:MAG: CRISPR-associated helicase Cas3' [candidate division Zixibacteria bacterium]